MTGDWKAMDPEDEDTLLDHDRCTECGHQVEKISEDMDPHYEEGELVVTTMWTCTECGQEYCQAAIFTLVATHTRMWWEGEE